MLTEELHNKLIKYEPNYFMKWLKILYWMSTSIFFKGVYHVKHKTLESSLEKNNTNFLIRK